MPQDNIFTGTAGDQTVVTNPPVNDQIPGATQKTYTYQEGDKVKTFTGSDDIFNAYANSQQFISTLKGEKTAIESELEELKTEYSKMTASQVSAQQVLDQINNQQSTEAPAAVAVDQNEIVTAVLEKISTGNEELTAQSNLDTAITTLTSVYGDKAQEHVAKVAGENGMSTAQAQELAKTNPTLFNNLFLSKTTASFSGTSTPASSVSQQQINQDPGTQPEQKILFDMSDKDRVARIRARREEIQKQSQL